jgi:uncharacterized MAPEG superfamily protein
MIQITIIAALICVTILVVTSAIKDAGNRRERENARRDYLALEEANARRQAEADRNARAMSFYNFQTALSVLEKHTLASTETARQTAKLMAEMAKDGGREAAEEMRARAIVGAYTQYLIGQKAEEQKKERYWEKVVPDEYI